MKNIMETKFNFKSSVCTDKNQSERLLALGLKKETADMCYRYANTVKGEKKYELIVEAAWSQEVIDEYVRFGTKIGLFDNLVHPCSKPVTPLEARADVTKNDIPAWSLHRLMCLVFNSGGTRVEFFEDDDAYEILIYKIEMRIKEGYFNNKYLCEK
jgi:hypothetical protein